jgi:hypothetical protein
LETYLILNVDGFTTRLKERESTVENVRVDECSDLVVDEFDCYLLMNGLLEEIGVTIFEYVLHFNSDG